jgi:pyridoxamine 5'-phosphate oxidase
MRSALRALDLGAAHAVARIVDRFEILFVHRRVKTRPSAARFELRAGAKKLGIAAHAMIRAVVVKIPVFAGECRLRAALAGDLILLRRQLFFPLRVRLLHAFSLQWNLANQDPIELFKKWFEAAEQAGLAEPNAMTLATATKAGKPSARVVLLKSFDEQGFVFYTNYNSRKGHELAENPHAALVVFWQPLERQIRITGRVTKVSAEESDQYFQSRPLGSRFSAAVSKQSSVIASREVLLKKLKLIEQKYPKGDPPRPIHWGGFRVHPKEIEFWQGGQFRLHDRLRYRRRRDGSWSVDRLSP